jgi:hypothetical protein
MTAAYYSALCRPKLVKRGLEVAMIGVGVAAIFSLNLLGLAGWLQYMLSLWAITFVAVASLATAAMALCIPSITASALRNGAKKARCALVVPAGLVAFGLIMFYDFALPAAIQWMLLPAMLVLPLVVIAVGWVVARARAKRARRRFEIALDVRLQLRP